MDFVTIRVVCPEDLAEVIIAQLFEVGFDSFLALDDGFEGSCEAEKFSEEQVQNILNPFEHLSFTIQEADKINWNEEWEKNYDPIIVDGKCIVRAGFHAPQPQFEYEIIVTPKMSFGTGHHATTYQVLAYQMQLDHTNKKVLDVGTGTGILAIMAAKRGASFIVASDIDDWCMENSAENFKINEANVSLLKAQIEEVHEGNFDIVIANINKNVLLSQIGEYSARLSPGGHLILSGFYEEDSQDLEDEAARYALKKISHSVKDNWAMLVLSKQSI